MIEKGLCYQALHAVSGIYGTICYCHHIELGLGRFVLLLRWSDDRPLRSNRVLPAYPAIAPGFHSQIFIGVATPNLRSQINETNG
jgi:hypothetical protein